MKWIFGGLALIAASVILVGGWIGGELRYANCINAAEARYPSAYEPRSTDNKGRLEEELGIGASGAHFVFYESAERKDAISSCSRWP